jgi:peptidyl-dipeptidase A
VLREATGSDLSAKAMVEYFEPLRLWLVEQNRGRVYTLSEL